MFDHLTIYDPRERLVVGLADAVLAAAALVGRMVPRRAPVETPRRILLLRLERIGDLLMTIAAVREVRRRAPDAHIDLVVGSWNEPLAARIEQVDRLETLDAPWLARGRGRAAGELLHRAWTWRGRHYDLAINFEGDIRSNSLVWLSGARRRIGFAMAGGGPLLTDAVAHDAARHTAENAMRLVDRAFPRADSAAGHVTALSGEAHRLPLPDDARHRAAEQLKDAGTRPLIGVHASGGRAIKQWDPDAFVQVALHLARRHDAAIVLTGAPEDRSIVQYVRSRLPPDIQVVDVGGMLDVVTLAAVLECLVVLVTGDTGPMHLAAAVGTPVVAVFGPSDPGRYAPLGSASKIVRIELPCSPCNRIRKPPLRCQGHVPDCLRGVTAERVAAAADELLTSVGQARHPVWSGRNTTRGERG
jgi:lipopolysaccharide heptosyltransferase II